MIEQNPIYKAVEDKLVNDAKFEIFCYKENRFGKLKWRADHCVTASAIKKYTKYIADKLNISEKEAFKEIQGDIEYVYNMWVIKDDAIFTDVVSDKQYTLDDIYKAFNGDNKGFASFIKAYIEYKKETYEKA